MKQATKKVAGLAGSALMLASMGSGALVAFADDGATAPQQPAKDVVAEDTATETVMMDKVVGTFTFTQNDSATAAAIRSAIGMAGQYLCGGLPVVDAEADYSRWAIALKGDVSHPFITTIGELQNDDELVTQLMGCACAANPADGKASLNAEVTGVSMNVLLDRLGIAEGANTVVFKSADGYEVALPLIYLRTHMCPIVFNVAGSPIVESMGGANQLWLGSTSARYFARDIVSITVETRDEAPAAPGSPEAGDTYANLPNIGVAFGGEVE